MKTRRWNRCRIALLLFAAGLFTCIVGPSVVLGILSPVGEGADLIGAQLLSIGFAAAPGFILIVAATYLMFF